MFYRILAQHRDLGWLSSYQQALPSQLWPAVFSRLYGKRPFERIQHAYFFPKPFSSYKFWARYLPGVARRDRPLTAEDVPEASIEPLREAIERILRYQGKRRFLTKVTGWARMAYFNRIFPDMQFIYLKRQPISIVASWVNAGWLNVTGELGTEAWEWGEVPQQYHEWWQELGGGPLLSAAVKTQLDIDDFYCNYMQFSDRTYVLNYEDLVTDPRRYLCEVAEFCGLEWTPEFDGVVNRVKVRNYADRWKQQIPEEKAGPVLEFFERANAQNRVPEQVLPVAVRSQV